MMWQIHMHQASLNQIIHQAHKQHKQNSRLITIVSAQPFTMTQLSKTGQCIFSHLPTDRIPGTINPYPQLKEMGEHLLRNQPKQKSRACAAQNSLPHRPQAVFKPNKIQAPGSQPQYATIYRQAIVEIVHPIPHEVST